MSIKIFLTVLSMSLSFQAVSIAAKKEHLTERLVGIRAQVLGLEQSLVDAVKLQKEAHSNLKKIKELLKLQRQERDLGRSRMAELEKTIRDLEIRRENLREKIKIQQAEVRSFLTELGRTLKEEPREYHLPAREQLEAPRRRVLANLVERGLKEIEVVRIDLADADDLEEKIQEERSQLTYLFHEVAEQESVLQLNEQLQVDLIKKKHAERLTQLENYRKLKSAQSQVENLIGAFSARMELEKSVDTERQAARAMSQGLFAQLRGKLIWPVAGKIISSFGKSFDAKTNLTIFKKGVELESKALDPVKAVSAGKIAYSGELSSYGRVTIVDHGDHFYSLCANLGELKRKVGDWVAAGDEIGRVDASGTPVYFEIRARNVAVNPLQWVSR